MYAPLDIADTSRHRFAAVLVIAGLVLSAFARLVLQPGGLLVDGDRPAFQQHERQRDASPGNDLTRLFLPQHLRAARAVASTGRIPAWDTAGFGGRPLIGNPQAGLWYPPVWLFWAWPRPAMLGWITVGHLIFAGLGAWRLARDIGLDRAPSLVSAGAFAIGPYLLGHVAAGHLPHVWAISWYPWAFLAARRARGGSCRGAAVLATSWSGCLLAGHPQGAILLGLALGGWWLSDLVSRQIRTTCNDSRLSWKVSMISVVLALLAAITAVEWLPDVAVASWGLESGRRPSWGELGQCRLRVENLLQLAGPRVLGGASDYFGRDNQWEACLSFGLAVLLLAVLGATASARRREARGWLALAVGSLWFASGPPLGLFAVCATLFPPLCSLRAPGRALFLTAVSVSVLSGLGAEVIWKGSERVAPRILYRRVRRGLVITAGLIALGCLLAFVFNDIPQESPGLDARGWALPRSTVAIVMLGCRRLACDPLVIFMISLILITSTWWDRSKDRRPAAAFVTAMALLELVFWGIAMIPVSPASRFLGPDVVSRTLAERMPASGPGPRILVRESVWSSLTSSQANIDRTDIYDRFQVKHGASLYEPLYALLNAPRPREAADPSLAHEMLGLRRALLDRLAVGFVVHDVPGTTLGWPGIETDNPRNVPRWIFAHPAPLPRAYVVPRVEVVPDHAGAVSRFPDVPARAAVLAVSDPLGDLDGLRQTFTPATIERPAPDRLRIEVTTQAPGLLVVAETWMPGWSARDVSGNDMPIHRGNGAQMFVALRHAGRHRVFLEYRAPGLGTAFLLTGLGLIAACGLFVAAGSNQTHPMRLRRIHSALKSAANRRRNGQLSQSRTSR